MPLKAAGTASAYDVIKQEQGIICKFMFNLSRPKGYTEAFTFNVSNGGKITNELKNGALVLNIPTELRKPGRVFALIGINKYGATQLYTDALTSTTNTTKSTVSSKKAK